MAMCPNCGRQVSDDATFCPACGAGIPAATSGGSGTPPPQQPTPPPGPAPVPQPPGPPMGTQPPYAQTPTGAPPAHVPGVVPPPTPKSKSPGCKIAIIATIVGGLIVAACIVVLVLFVFGAVKAPVDVTNRYIEAVNEGDAQEAWDLLHPGSPLKQEYSLITFEANIVDPSIKLDTWNANEVDVQDSRAEVGVDMEAEDGTDFRVVFTLRKDGDDWKIYDYSSS